MTGLAAALVLVVLAAAGSARAGQDGTERASAVLAETRAALGGEERLAQLTALVAEGPFRRRGTGDVEGTIKLTLGGSGRIRPEEELHVMGGARVLRLAGMNGDNVWEDTSTRGLGSGQIVIRGAGPVAGDRESDPDAARQAQRQRLTALSERMMLALLATGDELSHVGIADAGGAQALVLEKTDPAGRPLRLLIDQETKMPIAISYMEVRPTMMGRGGRGMVMRGGSGGGAARGRGEVRMADPPPPSSVIMRLEEYRDVNGIRLPHLLVQLVDGQPVEEWTIRRYQVNPRLDAAVFDTPSGRGRSSYSNDRLHLSVEFESLERARAIAARRSLRRLRGMDRSARLMRMEKRRREPSRPSESPRSRNVSRTRTPREYGAGPSTRS